MILVSWDWISDTLKELGIMGDVARSHLLSEAKRLQGNINIKLQYRYLKNAKKGKASPTQTPYITELSKSPKIKHS